MEMNDLLLQALRQAELGEAIEGLVALDGALPLPEGGEAPATLVLTERTCALVAVAGERGQARDVARNPTLRWVSRVLGDRLSVDGRQLGVPLGRAGEARQLLALGRLRARSARRPFEPPSGRYVDPASAVQQAWLAAWLDEGELALVWLDTGSEVKVPSEVQGESLAPWRLLITDRRACLTAVAELGDALVTPLPPETLVVRKQLGRARVEAGAQAWLATLGNGALHAEVARLPALGRAERLREVARRNLPEHPALARRLLTLLAAEGQPLDGLLKALACGEDGAPWLPALREDEAAARSLARVLESWGFEEAPLLALVVAGVEQDPAGASWLLPLHRLALRLRLRAASPAQGVRAELALVEHLLLAGEAEEATERLEAALKALPDEQLADLLPPEHADLTAGEAGQALRVRILELLVAARGRQGAPDPATLAELARLQPLVPARLQALAEVAEAPLADRAREALQALAPGGLADPAPAPPDFAPRCLPEALLMGAVQHPAAREGGVLGWLQGWLARQTPPEASTLRRYCEALSPRRHAEASAALADATMALGLPGLLAYVSHGTLGTGLRAHEGSPPFVLIGGEHLYEDSELRMGPAELRFALGAELAHLRFKHRRVTDAEVWDGVTDKLRRLLEVTSSALIPGGAAAAGRAAGEAGTMALARSVFSEDVLRRVYGLEGAALVARVGEDAGRLAGAGAEVASRALAPRGAAPEPRSLAPRQVELVAAHRVMQLTADRAGLALCGDLRAALRAMIFADPDLRAEWPIVLRHGAGPALARRGPDGAMLHQDLAVRVAALLSFHLGEDLPRLREALGAPAPEEAARS